MAQLVAHHTGSVGVRGSNPLSSTEKNPRPYGLGFFAAWDRLGRFDDSFDDSCVRKPPRSRPHGRLDVALAVIAGHSTDLLRCRLGPGLSIGNSSFGFFGADGFRYKQVGPLLAHGGFVLDQFVGEADPQNPNNQCVSVRFVKVPPSWSPADDDGDR